MTASGIIYALTNNTLTGKILRGVCSIFILFYNVIVAVGFFMAGK